MAFGRRRRRAKRAPLTASKLRKKEAFMRSTALSAELRPRARRCARTFRHRAYHSDTQPRRLMARTLIRPAPSATFSRNGRRARGLRSPAPAPRSSGLLQIAGLQRQALRLVATAFDFPRDRRRGGCRGSSRRAKASSTFRTNHEHFLAWLRRSRHNAQQWGNGAEAAGTVAAPAQRSRPALLKIARRSARRAASPFPHPSMEPATHVDA